MFSGPAMSRVSAGIACLLGVHRVDLAHPAPEPRVVSINVAPGGLTLVMGPSGCGKSSMLRTMADACAAHGVRMVVPPGRVPSDRPVCDLFSGEPLEAMRLLCSAGLGDVRAMVRPFRELSEGQRARVRIALGVRRARRETASGARVVLAIDEFGSNLDWITARSVSVMLHRAVRVAPRFACVVATSRTDLLDHVAPTEIFELDSAGRARVRAGCAAPAPVRVRVRAGTRGEYASLAPLHYRPGRPATMERILSAIDVDSGALAGVLIVSRPVVHAAWRDMAWPGRYTSGSHRTRAQRINREVRCISRVIVDPRFRAMGVARRLVRAYLRNPLTVCTEAIAAMGHATATGGFFGGAGMTAYRLAPRGPDARMLDALDHVGVDPVCLADPMVLADRLRGADARFVHRELCTWACASGRTRRWRDGPVWEILAGAARTIASTPIAFAHTSIGASHRTRAA